MNISDPQIIYMILILPSLFGLTLIGDGINKIVHEERMGIVNIIAGILFFCLVMFVFFFFKSQADIIGG